MHMIMIIKVCAGIMSAHPGCTVEQVELLQDVTPQQCLLKGQEYLAKKQPYYNMNGFNITAWGCRREG
jgi:hypothetical protein